MKFMVFYRNTMAFIGLILLVVGTIIILKGL